MTAPHRFFSDNAALVHPKVLEAITAANAVDTAYDGDRWSARLDEALSERFGTTVRALWVATGTGANCLALARSVRPWHAILCHEEAHIEVDECGAPAFFLGGAKLMLIGGEGAKLDPATVTARLEAVRNDVHQVQVAAISITNATECGLAWRPAEVAAIGAIARERGLQLHMDGARFANAVAHVGCEPAEVTWRAGVHTLAFGGVKNGGLNAEAVLFFGDTVPDGVLETRKRSGHLQSKGRFLAAQLLALLEDDLWLENARAANAVAATLGAAAGSRAIHPVEANELFLRVRAHEAAALRALGFDFYDWGPDTARLVTSWHHRAEDVAPLAAAIAALPPYAA